MISFALAFVLCIMFAHWVADFVTQPHEVAVNKWNSLPHLVAHVGMYGFVLWFMMLLPFALVFPSMYSMYYSDRTFANVSILALCNCIAHGIIDFPESRLTHSLYAKQDYHNFFVVMGFCQFLHISILFVTADHFFHIF